MADHELAERLAGLASRVDNLMHLTIGAESRILQDQQDRLVKMALVAIVQEMEATNRKYQTAVKRVTEASEAIGDADESIQNVAEIISVVAKALDAAEGLLKKALVG
jgi:DNA repair ATPase RecN